MCELLISEEFVTAYGRSGQPLRAQVQRRVGQLMADPTHPSLRVHRIEAHPHKWECYVNRTHRIIFERIGDVIRLWKFGPHSIIDRIERTTFSPYTAFRRVASGDAVPTAAAYDGPADHIVVAEGHVFYRMTLTQLAMIVIPDQQPCAATFAAS
jgi:hypothetical protein